ncbi:DUF2744 domain-containing protein [Nocardia sp. NPDC056611]|uniref:phage gene 29 protein family protein n=1 Tax=Nocardia sp. NPDC056611 TaxID=3345877 RepID=UPI003671D857
MNPKIDYETDEVIKAEVKAIADTFINAPGMSGDPMMVPIPLAEVFAKHQHMLGARVHPEKAIIQFYAPWRGQRDAYNPSGYYGEPSDEPRPVPVIPNMREYTPEELAHIVGQLEEMGAIRYPEPPRDTARVLLD